MTLPKPTLQWSHNHQSKKPQPPTRWFKWMMRVRGILPCYLKDTSSILPNETGHPMDANQKVTPFGVVTDQRAQISLATRPRVSIQNGTLLKMRLNSFTLGIVGVCLLTNYHKPAIPWRQTSTISNCSGWNPVTVLSERWPSFQIEPLYTWRVVPRDATLTISCRQPWNMHRPWNGICLMLALLFFSFIVLVVTNSRFA